MNTRILVAVMAAILPAIDAPAKAPVTPTWAGAADRERGFVVFRRSYLEIIAPTTQPRRDDVGGTVRSAGARGEIEPLTLSAHALRDLKEVRATLGPLRTKGGAVLPASCISAKVVDTYGIRRFSKRRDPDGVVRGAWKILPFHLYLRDSRPLTVAAGQSRRFWFNVRAPRGATPGLYEGKIVVTADSGRAEVPVAFEVHPFELRRATQFRAMYFTMYPKIGSDYGMLEAFFRDMAEHGMNSVVLCSLAHLSPKGSVDKPYSHHPVSYRQVLDAVTRSGLCRDTGVVAGNFGAVEAVSWVRDRHQQHSWPEPLFMMGDEPEGAWVAKLAGRAAQCRKLGARSFFAMIGKPGGGYNQYSPQRRAHMEGPYLDTVGEALDIWCITWGQITEKVVARARAMNKQLWSYNGADTEPSRWMSGVFSAGLHSDGAWPA